MRAGSRGEEKLVAGEEDFKAARARVVLAVGALAALAVAEPGGGVGRAKVDGGDGGREANGRQQEQE